MPVFKLCLKVFYKNLPVMMIYVGVFVAVSILMASATRGINQEGFSQSRTRIAFISEDDSVLVDSFKDALSPVARFVELENEREVLQDALYFRQVGYIIKVPADFTEKMLNNEPIVLEKTAVPNSISAIYLDIRIEQYLKLARLYATSFDGDLVAMSEAIAKDMALETQVNLITTENKSSNQSFSTYFYNYLGYSLFSVLILGISTIILVFNHLDLRRRNTCSPIPASSINFQFIMANTLFALVTWGIMIGFCMMFDSKNINGIHTPLFMLNSLIFTLCAASISFLVGHSVKNREAISALTNIIALGPSFISGVFVPQEMLGESVLRVASFTPTYWYVKVNNTISQITILNNETTMEVFKLMGVQIAFAVAFMALALVVGKRKQMGYEV